MAHVRVVQSTVVCPMPLMLHLSDLKERVRGGGETLLAPNLMFCLFNGCNVLRRQQDQLRVRVLNGKVKKCGHADLQPADQALNNEVTYNMTPSKAVRYCAAIVRNWLSGWSGTNNQGRHLHCAC